MAKQVEIENGITGSVFATKKRLSKREEFYINKLYKGKIKTFEDWTTTLTNDGLLTK